MTPIDQTLPISRSLSHTEHGHHKEISLKSAEEIEITPDTEFYDQLLIIIRELGYPVPEGLCEGYGWLGMNSGLARQTSQFHKRISHITTVFEKSLKHGEINPSTIVSQFKDDVNILGFVETLLVAQEPDSYPELFPPRITPRYQGDRRSFYAVIELISSAALNELGGIIELVSYSGIYNESTLYQYLRQLKKVFFKSKVDAPIGLLLWTTSHTISLVFDRALNSWMTFDINQPDIKNIALSETDEIAEFVSKGFEMQEIGGVMTPLVFATHIFILRPAAKTLKTDLVTWMGKPKFKFIHQAHRQLLIHSNRDLSYWLHLAINEGDESLVSFLLGQEGLDLNLQDSESGFTALHFAIRIYRPKIVRSLLELGARTDIEDNYGNTPIMLAAQYGYHSMVDIFIEHEENTM